jgi:hypothetical protein
MIYQGNFVHNDITGEGLLQSPDGHIFFGKLTSAKKNGPGIYMYPNG